ncbi:DUF86 domain-containing protein [Emticicia sp. TH156]|uniref:HepT-like ribonuclease domain-containing protein n=1 Tax=Emticicia sp. TH156 TaxID=2067454 RepID=UPI000C7662E8|nr:DUF86 domain-containing protein [Emticicia sp. TH156]PLK45863.1 DUF86 domain-containing protein [Emticicia sp. TH156]
MKGRFGDVQRAQHILDAIKEIESFVGTLNYEEFQASSLIRSATERQLITIGEASWHLSDEVKNKYDEIDWRGIKGFRNIITHEYFGISVKMVWVVLINELPKLKQVAEKIIKEIGE